MIMELQMNSVSIEKSTKVNNFVKDTQAGALDAVGLRKRQSQEQTIFDIVVGLMKSGRSDVSTSEIQEAYERTYQRRIEKSTISARVNNLVTAERLCRSVDIRPCTVTGFGVHGVFAPLKQLSF